MIDFYLKGLDDAQVVHSRDHYGSNELTPPKRDPWFKLLLEKFKDPLIQILSIAAVIALVLGFFKSEFLEPIGIIVAIFIAVTIGFLNELAASKKFDLMSLGSDDVLVTVRRNGEITQIARKELVVGDLVLLEAGEEIPADIKIISGEFKVNQASLTGESKDVTKSLIAETGTFLSDLLLKSTLITEGTGYGIVTAIGDNTVIGKTARKAAEISDTETPLNKQLNGLANLINKIAFYAAGFLIFALLTKYFIIDRAYIGQDWMQITNDLLSFLMIAVALIVVAVPEGLPMAVTLALAYSMKRMTKANNLIRKMHACETLGATTLILTDKTGTLTKNQMEVVASSFVNNSYVTLNVAANSTAHINGTENIGNPTECALLRNMPVDNFVEVLRADNMFQRPFSSKDKYMHTITRYNKKLISLVKGAYEVIKPMCTEYVSDGILEECEKGRRVICFAYKECDLIDDAKVLENFTYNGFVAIADPIRAEVPEAIQIARNAGIEVKIVTGDDPITACEIAKQAHLSDYPLFNSGDVTSLDDTSLQNMDVFARTKPDDKQILVKRFQNLGEVVAMTGDGTNDAPALNHAEVGIAMNNGTAVAKEAADIILLDNSFPSIILGVKWGRSLYKNIQHFILFQLTINVVAIFIACVGPFIGIDLPFTVTQMLWVNLIMDTFAALALATEPANDAVMKERPRKPNSFIITTEMWFEIIGKAIVFLLFFIPVLILNVLSLTEFFTIFVMLQWWNLFDARVFGQNRSIFDGLLKNPAFVGISLVILIGQILIVQFGGEMFRTEPLSLFQWEVILTGTSCVVIIRELIYQVKKLFR